MTHLAQNLVSNQCSVNSSENSGYLVEDNGGLCRTEYAKIPALAVRRPDLSESPDLPLIAILSDSLNLRSVVPYQVKMELTLSASYCLER